MSKTNPDIETRMKVFHRDHGKCFICGRTLSASAFTLHHRRMRSHAWEGLNLPSNLITVCGSGTMGCHARIHAHPKESYVKAGWSAPTTITQKTFQCSANTEIENSS